MHPCEFGSSATRRKRRLASLLLTAVTLVAVHGCTVLRPASTPMESVKLEAHKPPGSTALVLLPGFGDDEETFSEEGFTDAIRKAAPTVDIVAVDAHFGYYREQNVVERLTKDVILPLREQGYDRIYLAGISIGGYGALGFARTHPDLIDGLLLFAPYLGPNDVIEEVRDSGGLCQYTPRGPLSENNEGFARANFKWLRSAVCGPERMPFYTAVGDKDDIARALPYITRELPNSHSIVLEGGHGWEVWTPAAQELVGRALGNLPDAARAKTTEHDDQSVSLKR